ncbi:HpcH/HpaI aldolase/citrate lyase family protein [Agrococcus carbonis]|uniref:Citrate lyase subunit beta / citryl-CoA lyase n=1 Tax=Agrococcus carbonis TaxID=684552 RepID=A0A1H1TCU1_9MICO|nr:CoA ester lyase [Agrococcus carbonis]SDS57389.1 citrate lyase subunit beta / citryl-CoA lyase [Agrococcus carbonis]
MTLLGMGPALLFCPGDRPDRFQNAADRADAVILDLEDAVGPESKAAAREAVQAASLDPAGTIVRVQDASADGFEDDLAAVAASPFRTVMLAKAESAAQVDRVVAAVPGARVVVLVETARGVLAVEPLVAHEAVVGVMWGAEDLVASIGGTSSRDASGAYRDVAVHARSRILLAAGAFGKTAIDAIRTDIADLDGAHAEAVDAAASGFGAKAAIHPNHVEPYRRAFAPTAEQLDEARRILAAAEATPGVFSFEGRMVDEPILRHARSVVARAHTLGA